MGAAHVHVYQGFFPAPAEDAGLWEDCAAGEPLLPGGQPALQGCAALPGLQRLLLVAAAVRSQAWT